MSTSLAAAFRSGNGRKTKWQGDVVHSLLQLSVKDGDTIEITRLESSPTRAQALKVAADKGSLRANGVVVSPIAIWTHTSPEQVTLEVVGRKTRSVDIWNSWSFDGVDSSWLGSAGMIVESHRQRPHSAMQRWVGRTNLRRPRRQDRDSTWVRKTPSARSVSRSDPGS